MEKSIWINVSFYDWGKFIRVTIFNDGKHTHYENVTQASYNRLRRLQDSFYK